MTIAALLIVDQRPTAVGVHLSTRAFLGGHARSSARAESPWRLLFGVMFTHPSVLSSTDKSHQEAGSRRTEFEHRKVPPALLRPLLRTRVRQVPGTAENALAGSERCLRPRRSS